MLFNFVGIFASSAVNIYINLSIPPSVRENKLEKPWSDYHEIWYRRKFVVSIQFSFRSNKCYDQL